MSDIDPKDFWLKSQMGVQIVNPIASCYGPVPEECPHIEMVVDTKKFNPRFFLFTLYALLSLGASAGIVLGCYMVSYLSYLCSFYPAIGLIRLSLLFFEIAFKDEGLFKYTYKEKS